MTRSSTTKKRAQTTGRALAGCAACLLFACTAWADIIVPPPSLHIDLGYNPSAGPGQPPGLSASYTSPGSYSLGTARANYDGFPNPTGAAHASSSTDTQSSSSVVLYYYFQVVGPDSVAVPIDVSGSLYAAATGINGSNAGTADLRVSAATQGELTVECGAGSLQASCQDVVTGQIVGSDNSLSQVLHVTGYAGSNYELRLEAIAGSNYGGTADASFDPVISIDPTFANAGAYSIAVSPGVGNSLGAVATAPEPGSMALVFAGILGVAGCRTRHRVCGSSRNVAQT